MSNKYIDDEWKNSLIGKDETRIYINPRNITLPPANEDDVSLVLQPPQKGFHYVINGGLGMTDLDYIDGGDGTTDLDYYDGGDGIGF